MRPGIEAVAFDLDGTLYPNYSLNGRLIPFALKNLRLLLAFGKARKILHSERNGPAQTGSRATGPDTGPAGGGRAGFYDEQAALVADIVGAEPEIIRDKIENLIYRGWERHFKKIKLYPGVLETLDAFRRAGLKLGLLSDFPPEAKLEYLGIGACWDAVLCSEQIGSLKPKSAPFAELARALDLEPGKILYVGNSFRYDVIGAKKAGMSAALINRTLFSTGAGGKGGERGFRADFVFYDYRQLYNYMLS